MGHVSAHVSPQEIFSSLKKDSIFKEWHARHPNTFLSHFFCALSDGMEMKESWEIGFFDAAKEKITVFIKLENGSFEVKPEDGVFKDKKNIVEELFLQKVKVSFNEAINLFHEQCPVLFPKEQIGNGFVVLQSLQQKTVWNFAFITKSLQYLNIKINAITGEVISHQMINVVEKN